MTRHDHLRFFAVWTARSGYALDAYPDEIDRYRRDMIRHRERFAGPFDTADEAIAVAIKALERGQPRPAGCRATRKEGESR